MSPRLKNIALKYKAITGESIRHSLRWVAHNKDIYTKYLQDPNSPRVRNERNEDYVYNELIFQGFVEESKFKKRKECYYIVSKGFKRHPRLIYPVHASNSTLCLTKGYKNIYDLCSEVGLPNWTGTDIKYKL